MERLWAIIAGIAVVLAVSVVIARTGEPVKATVAAAEVVMPTIAPPTPPPPTPKPAPKPTAAPTGRVGAVAPTHDTFLKAAPVANAPNIRLLRTGGLLPVGPLKNGYYYAFTPDEVHGWVAASAVRTYLAAPKVTHALQGATLVIDPGHGGSQTGAKGPTGYREKDANLDIVRRILPQLKGARVFITRSHSTAGLKYRSALANRLNADAFVSVHNNASHVSHWSKPGTDTFYQERSARSKRLAGLIYEEVTRSLSTIKRQWARDPLPGVKFRKNGKGIDYYAVLRQTDVPAVIVENMFIGDRKEEMMLREPKIRQLLADAIVRGIKRYLTTNDQGSGFVNPYAMRLACAVTGCVLAAK